jgi:hypothetical protein
LPNETAEDEVEGLVETRNGRPQRKRKMHNYLELARGTEESAFMICMSEALNVDSPKNFSEAMNSIFADRWSEAIREELISINQHIVVTVLLILRASAIFSAPVGPISSNSS